VGLNENQFCKWGEIKVPGPKSDKKMLFQTLRRFQSVLGLVLIFVLAIILSPRARDGAIIFLDPGNITDILRQVSEIGIMALAMTFVILTAGIDLSVGSVLALSAALVAKLLTVWAPEVSPAMHIILAVLISLGAGTLVGMINGFVIANLKIQPFIVTLAAMIGIRGLAKWMTNNANIDIGFGSETAALFANILSMKIVVIGSFLALAVIFAILLSKTVFGRYSRAIGDNSLAAAYSGLPIKRTLIWVYALSGMMAGLAGVIHCAQNRQGSPNDGVAYELEAIAAVVIGGTSLAGGKGSIVGTIVGTLIMGILTNILRLNNVDSNLEMMLKAVIIIAAVRIQLKKSSI
jgi:ribose transport system permease protein